MAISSTSAVFAFLGPTQDIARAPVDIAAQGPNPSITSGWALATVVVSTSGVVSAPLTAAGAETAFEGALRSTSLSTGGGATTGSTALMTLAAANTSRKGVAIGNNAGATLLVDLSTALSTSQYLAPVSASGGYYELPFGYTGAVYGMLTAPSTLNIVAREVL